MFYAYLFVCNAEQLRRQCNFSYDISINKNIKKCFIFILYIYQEIIHGNERYLRKKIDLKREYYDQQKKRKATTTHGIKETKKKKSAEKHKKTFARSFHLLPCVIVAVPLVLYCYHCRNIKLYILFLFFCLVLAV